MEVTYIALSARRASVPALCLSARRETPGLSDPPKPRLMFHQYAPTRTPSEDINAPKALPKFVPGKFSGCVCVCVCVCVSGCREAKLRAASSRTY